MSDFLDNIPFGKAPALLLLLAVASGLYLLANPVPNPEADLTVWTFEHSRSQLYEEQEADFEAAVGNQELVVNNIAYEALQSRLRSALWADLDVPDIVELEISGAGSFFRGEIEHVGFLDLTPYIEKDNLDELIVATRFTPYRNRGRQFGLPLDIHPVMVAYRRDIFEELGINPEELRTWDDFLRVGRNVTIPGERYMIQLSESNPFQFEMLLFQNGGGYFNADGDLLIDSEETIEALMTYVPMVAGEGRISIDLGGDAFTQAIENGTILCVLAPDWLAHFITLIAPQVEGRMALMPMPAFEPGGRRTSTAGGSMIAITEASPNPDLAWEFIRYFWLNEEAAEERFRETGILPPFKEAWSLPAFSEPDPFWSNQRVGQLFASVAEEVPPQHASPFVAVAKAEMGNVLSACSRYYRDNGEEGFEEFARRRLARAAEDIRRLMSRDPFR